MDETGHVTFVGRKIECLRIKHYGDMFFPNQIIEAAKKDTRTQNVQVSSASYNSMCKTLDF